MINMPPSLQDLVDANPDAETFRFGDNEQMCREILALVRSGKKTATIEDMRAYTEGSDAYPQVGRQDFALNWDGTPAVMLETVEVFQLRFDQMTEGFVTAQGEFRDLAHWREGYQEYFERNMGFSRDMKLMCERFKLVKDYG